MMQIMIFIITDLCRHGNKMITPHSISMTHTILIMLPVRFYSEESIKRNLQERLRSTKVFILLVGENTKYLYKFVRWEIEQAIKRGLPIVVVNLNGKRNKDANLCPLILDNELSLHVSFNQKIIAKALSSWETSHKTYRSEGKTGAYVYDEGIYKALGL